MYQSYSNITFDKHLIPNEFKKEIDSLTSQCTELYQKQEKIKYETCEEILQRILEHSKTPNCLNMYDVRLRDSSPDQGCGRTWPNGLDLTESYLSVILQFYI